VSVGCVTEVVGVDMNVTLGVVSGGGLLGGLVGGRGVGVGAVVSERAAQMPSISGGARLQT
jgi:hypothetical protein